MQYFPPVHWAASETPSARGGSASDSLRQLDEASPNWPELWHSASLHPATQAVVFALSKAAHTTEYLLILNVLMSSLHLEENSFSNI